MSRWFALMVWLGLMNLPAYAQDSDSVAGANEHDDLAEASWVALFNGEDLTGWTPKFAGHPMGVNLHETFRVVDGLLTVSYADWPHDWGGEFGHLFYDVDLSHYDIRATFRFTGEQLQGGPTWAYRNSGIKVHCTLVDAFTEDQDVPVSVEVQLLGAQADGGERPCGNFCTPMTQGLIDGELVTEHVIDNGGPTIQLEEWATVLVEVRGDERITVFINGQRVGEMTQPQLDDGTPLGSGSLCIQAETHPIEFRSIELRVVEANN